MTDKKKYVAIRHAGCKYVVYPTIELECRISEARGEKDVWYFQTTKSIVDLARAGVFGAYNAFDEAYAALYNVDPGIVLIYKPVQPPTQ